MKGFIFTIEATIALFFGLALAATITNLYLSASEKSVQELYSQQVAQDILNVLDKNGTLKNLLPATGGSTTLQAALNETLPIPYGARINLTVYAYKDNACPNDYCRTICQNCNSQTGFCACKNITVTIGTVPPDGISVAQRFFTNNSNNKFGLGTIEVWK